MATLFDPIDIGPYPLAHRVVMAPLTRRRAQLDGVPARLASTYYSERASEGGFMITEAAVISPRGVRYVRTPGIFARGHIAGWRPNYPFAARERVA